MNDQPPRPNRRSIRLKDFDYAQDGAYYVTIVTQDRRELFGRIDDGILKLSHQGDMIALWWNKLTQLSPSISTDAFVAMPNHVHGIIMLEGSSGASTGPPLPAIVRWFKTMTTNAYIRGVNERGWPAFDRRLWQRGFHDRILRDEDELQAVREYIVNNPLRWDEDPENA